MAVVRDLRVGRLPATGLPFATAVSGSGRYFVDQYTNPFLVKGDTLWGAVVNLSTANWSTLAASRAGHGFNLIIVDLISSAAQGGRDDTSTFDGIFPFTSGNLNTPNETFWARVDTFLTTAQTNGITMALYPMDWYSMTSGMFFSGKSNADCQAYGAFLGARYKNRPNILWVFGNDYQVETSTINNQYDSFLTGLRGAGDNHLVSIQNNYHKSHSWDYTFWASKVQWDCDYSYMVQYDSCKIGYDHSPTMPSIMWEAAYTGEAYTGGDVPLTIRKQIGWSLTQGSPGEVMGTQDWRLADSGWSTRLDETVMVGCTNLRAVFEAVQWWTLVPSTTFVTSGAGTRVVASAESSVGSPDWPAASDYASSAVSADGKLAMVYLPTQRAIAVNTAVLGSSPTGTWVNASTGATTAAGSLAGSVTPPSSGDWVLKITAT
jgi:hypothetical protein